jgi:predicted DNA-binding protein YlxM (UPF0122 family)
MEEEYYSINEICRKFKISHSTILSRVHKKEPKINTYFDFQLSDPSSLI